MEKKLVKMTALVLFVLSLLSGCSQPTDSSSKVTTPETPAGPQNFVTSASDTGFVTSSWSAVSGATKYEVYYAESGADTATKTLIKETTETTYSFQNCYQSKDLYLYVRALVGSAYTDYSYSWCQFKDGNLTIQNMSADETLTDVATCLDLGESDSPWQSLDTSIKARTYDSLLCVPVGSWKAKFTSSNGQTYTTDSYPVKSKYNTIISYNGNGSISVAYDEIIERETWTFKNLTSYTVKLTIEKGIPDTITLTEYGTGYSNAPVGNFNYTYSPANLVTPIKTGTREISFQGK